MRIARSLPVRTSTGTEREVLCPTCRGSAVLQVPGLLVLCWLGAMSHCRDIPCGLASCASCCGRDTRTALLPGSMSYVLNDCRLCPLPMALEVSVHLIDVDGWVSLPLAVEKTFSTPCLREQLRGRSEWCRVMELKSFYALLSSEFKSSVSFPCVPSPALL